MTGRPAWARTAVTTTEAWAGVPLVADVVDDALRHAPAPLGTVRRPGGAAGRAGAAAGPDRRWRRARGRRCRRRPGAGRGRARRPSATGRARSGGRPARAYPR